MKMNDGKNLTIPTVSLSTVREIFQRTSLEFQQSYICGHILTQSRWLIYLGRVQTILDIARVLADEPFITEVNDFMIEMEGVRVAA